MGQKSKSMSSENETKGAKDMKAEGHDKSGDMNAQSREGQTGNQNAQTREGQTGKMNAQTKSSTDTSRSQTTTGNAATSATAAPPAEKRTQIVSAIKSEKIEEVGSNVNYQPFGGRDRPVDGALLPASSADRRNLSGMARLRSHPRARAIRNRAARDARDRLHHRELTGLERGRLRPPSTFQNPAAVRRGFAVSEAPRTAAPRPSAPWRHQGEFSTVLG